jgi:RNAse (barnase) inhibitor barstar
MNSVRIDWSEIKSVDDFYEAAFFQTQAPAWHGRNWHALYDSWVTGDICKGGPPFSFEFKNSEPASQLPGEFIREVQDIARESVRTHGGTLTLA